MSRVIFVKIFQFSSWLFGHLGNRLDEKAKVNSKFTTSQTSKQKITIHLLPDISRSKGNQAMKFGQLIRYNVRNIFLQKSIRK